MTIPCLQVGRSSWVWGLETSTLPDVADDVDHLAGSELLYGYRTLAEALAARTPGSCALQLRLVADGTPAGAGRVRAVLLGRARDPERAAELYDLATSTLPPELGLELVADLEDLRALLAAYPAEGAAVVEIRRRVEDVSTVPVRQGDGSLQPAVLLWDPSSVGLRLTSSVLARASAHTSVLLHIEPARPSVAVFEHIEDTIRDIVSDLDVASSPLRLQVADEYRGRLRDLRHSALLLRVLVTSAGPVPAALATSVGLALTGEGGFEVRAPRDDHQHFAWFDLVESLSAPPERGTAVDELGLLAAPAEAGRVVRFPRPATGGSPGLHSSPLAVLPRGAEPARPPGSRLVRLGTALGGGDVGLTLGELNQHLLVAGLPGFGKTVTTQTILSQLWATHDVPFLVIDPAKSDYSALVNELGDDVRFVELGPDDVAFNPFAVPEGCSRISHAGRVLAAFDAAFQLSTAWPGGYVTFARALYRAYEVGAPTLTSLQESLGAVLDESGFAGADGNNIRAALLGRLEFLAQGPLGVALSAPVSAGIDFAELTRLPTVVGLRGFAGPMERALVFGLLLSGLISYREANPVRGQLGHVTVLEEAHRLLGASGEGVAGEGVRLFVEAIAELRGSGEGFVVVDQAPTLLHPGILKLAGSYCSHRLVDRAERLAVGSGLLLDERQSEDLARLKPGQVVLHSATRSVGVVCQVEPADGLLEPPRVPPPLQRLPWRTSDVDDETEQQNRLRDLVSRASSPADALIEAALELQQVHRDPVDFRRALRAAADLVRDEIRRRST